MDLRSSCIPVLLLILAAFYTPCGIAQDVATQKAAVEKGRKFLLGAQLPDGSWRNELGESREAGMRVAITAMCMNALLRWSGDSETLKAAKRGLEFIAKNTKGLDSPFDVNPQFNFNTWGIAFGLSHLCEAVDRWPGKKPDVKVTLAAITKRAVRTQLPCGGWSYLKTDRSGNPVVDGSVSFLTAGTLEGLLRARKHGVAIDRKVIERGLEDLSRLFNRTSRLAYSHEGKYRTRGGGDAAGRSIQGILTLLEGGKSKRETLVKALGTFFAERNEYVKTRKNRGHTPPTMIAGYYYYYVHHYAARALRFLGSDPKGLAGEVRKAFIKEQNQNGSWMDTVSCGTTCGTAFVLIAFDELRSMLWRDSLKDGLALGREKGVPVLVFLSDGRKASKAMKKAFASEPVTACLSEFVCVRIEADRKHALRRKTKIRTGPAVLVLDAKAENPVAKPVKVLKGRRSSRSLGRSLKSVIDEWKKSRESTPDPANPASTGPLDAAAADKKVRALLTKEGARPGGILRVRRFPALVAKGWTVGEDRKGSSVILRATEASYFYLIDRKAGPRYAHSVEYLLVTKAEGKITRKAGEWWPTVKNDKGEAVTVVDGKPVAGRGAAWWNDLSYLVMGDKGPSIQDAQNAVKMSWMFAKFPAGSQSMVLYSCPATLPKGGTVWADGKQVFKATNASLLMAVQCFREKPFPKEMTLICYDRVNKKATDVAVKHTPVLKDAKKKAITTDDSGKKLGAWYAEESHSFLSRAGFGR